MSYKTEKTIQKALFRWLSRFWNNNEGQNEQDLKHTAFSLTRLIEGQNIPDEERYALITAFFQSGKTFLMIVVGMLYLSHGYTPVYILPRSSQAKQTLERMREIFRLAREAMQEIGFEPEETAVFEEILYHTSENPMDDPDKIHEAAKGLRPRAILCVKHHKHIRRIVDNIESDSRVCLFIDEAHSCGGYKRMDTDAENLHDESVEYDIQINALKSYASKIFLVSATSANIIASETQLWSDSIYVKPSSPYYRGPLHIDYEVIRNSPEEIDSILLELSRKELPVRTNYRDGGEDVHPIVALIHVERRIERQRELLDSFKGEGELDQEILDAGWVVMTFQQEGIRMYHHSLSDRFITIGGSILRCDGDGEVLLKSAQPPDVLEWLEGNGGVERFSRIVFIAYDMADEGISFSTHRGSRWHLSDAVVLGNHSSARNAQIVHRLCGNHGDDLPLRAWTTMASKKKTLKEFMLHDSIVSDLTNLKAYGNFRVCDYVKKQPVPENKVPTRFVTTKPLPGHSKKVIPTCANPNKDREEKAFKSRKSAVEVCVEWDYEKFSKSLEEIKGEKFERVIYEEAGKRQVGPGCIYRVRLDALSAAKRQVCDRVMEYLGARKDKWIHRSEIINELESHYRVNTLRSYLTRLCQNVNESEECGVESGGLFFRKKCTGTEWDVLLCQ